MPNIFLTNQCGRGCKFCFAQEGPWRDDYAPRPLTMDEVKEFVNLKARKKQKERGILGGEPLKYPDLAKVIELMWASSLSPKIFTSGIWPVDGKIPETIKGGLQFVLNIAPWDTYSEEQKKNLDYFLKTYHKYISLSFTILDTNISPEFLIDYISGYKLNPMIRISLALPMMGKKNQYIHRKDYRHAALFILDLAAKASAKKIKLGMDCGFVACMFRTVEIGKLQRYGTDLSFVCKPIMDVGPDMKSWHCFPLSQLKLLSLREYDYLDTAAAEFRQMTNDLKFQTGKGIFERCSDCKYMERGQCDGGCLGHTISNPENAAMEILTTGQV